MCPSPAHPKPLMKPEDMAHSHGPGSVAGYSRNGPGARSPPGVQQGLMTVWVRSEAAARMPVPGRPQGPRPPSRMLALRWPHSLGVAQRLSCSTASIETWRVISLLLDLKAWSAFEEREEKRRSLQQSAMPTMCACNDLRSRRPWSQPQMCPASFSCSHQSKPMPMGVEDVEVAGEAGESARVCASFHRHLAPASTTSAAEARVWAH